MRFLYVLILLLALAAVLVSLCKTTKPSHSSIWTAASTAPCRSCRHRLPVGHVERLDRNWLAEAFAAGATERREG